MSKGNTFENDLLSLRSDQQAGRIRMPAKDAYEVEVVLADGSAYPHKGRITFANADFNPQTGTFLLRATIPNPKGELHPGALLVRRHELRPPRKLPLVLARELLGALGQPQQPR